MGHQARQAHQGDVPTSQPTRRTAFYAVWRAATLALARPAAHRIANRGERTVAVAAGDVGGQALALGLVDEVAMDVVPVVFGSGKRCFGSVDGQHLLEDPDVVIRGDRVLHLRYRVRRSGARRRV